MDLKDEIAARTQPGAIRTLKDFGSDRDGFAFLGEPIDAKAADGAGGFVGTITTATKDRDGDVLLPSGAEIDPALPLLWQHQWDKPIGRLKEFTKSSERVSGRFVFADTPLAKDAQALIDIGALRISHGFRPIEFEPLRDDKGQQTGGYLVKRYEVFEVSLVSVPSNPEAIVTEIQRRGFDPASVEMKSFIDGLRTKAAGSFGKGHTVAAIDEVVSKTVIESRPESAKYSSKRYTGKHARTGQEVLYRGSAVETPSELDRAKLGVFLKRLSGHGLDEHERGLWEELLNEPWVNAKDASTIKTGVKALLNDGTSGGQDLVPEFLDVALIQLPLLFGELLPQVSIVDIPRGSEVIGASVGNPSVSWNVSEGSSMGLFTTTGLVNDIGASIHSVHCAVEVGRDLMADSAASIGDRLVENIGQSMAAELDRVIANGDGTTQPEGIFNASGTTTVASEEGTSGPYTVGDVERLYFGIGKQYRNAARRPCYVGNDTTYRRIRAIKVGTSDERRIFGMSHSDYQLMERPFLVQNDIPDTHVAFCAMERYRLYRRAGQTVRWVTEGKELSLKNLALLIVRGRYGGLLVDGNACAKITSGQLAKAG